jgi:integrase
MSVKVREKVISKGRKSLYLDFYPAIINPSTGQTTRREFLGLYIYARPKNEIEKEYNAEKRAIAEATRGLREVSIKNNEFGFIDKEKGKADFLEYFKHVAEKRNDKNWLVAYKHFEAYTKGSCMFLDVNENFCNGFREYLLTAKNLNSVQNKTVSVNTAVSYFGKFRALLKCAFREKLLNENVNDRLDGITPEETQREFLTLDELQTLAQTPCNIPILKNAALFSALTGLRFSDIEKLTWGEIQGNIESGYSIQFRQQKTKGVEYMPIANEAVELLGNRKEPGQQVFEGLYYGLAQNPLKAWLKDAGINRNVTFHCFRHTYATLQLSLGTDIYTVSKMLGHRNLKTTQVYTHLIDQKKRDATEKIKLKI